MLPTPYVALRQTGSAWRASVGFRLAELLAERLPSDAPPAARAQRLAEAHENSARLAELIAGWSRPVSVELHLVSRPSLDEQQAVGQVELAVRLTERESEREHALARCLSDYVALRTLLTTFWRQARFTPLLNEKEFQRAFYPFEPRPVHRPAGGGARQSRHRHRFRMRRRAGAGPGVGAEKPAARPGLSGRPGTLAPGTLPLPVGSRERCHRCCKGRGAVLAASYDAVVIHGRFCQIGNRR